MNREQVENVVAQARSRRFPMDVIHIDGWLSGHYYQALGVDACDFRWNYQGFPEPKQMFRKLAAQGISVSLWTNPYVPEDSPLYAEAAQKGFLVHDAQGGVSRLEFGEHAGLVDFTNPAATEWWKEHLRELLRMGASVFKADYGDRVPASAVFFNGQTGATMHNLYTMLYTKAEFEAVREVNGVGMIWRRSGYIGSQRYPGTWAGDTQPTWDGLRSALRGGLSAGLSGEAFWSNDIGGFNGPQPDKELYVRWAEFGLFIPLSRFHGTTPREPWAYDSQAEQIVTKYARLRYRLIPYLLRAASESTATGVPIMRHMALEFPDEPNVQTLDDQYTLGSDLIVAPILEEGARSRFVYFPRGKWKAFELPDRVYIGPGFAQVTAPLDMIPIFVRQGAHVPMLAEDVQSLKDPTILQHTVLWPALMLNRKEKPRAATR
jgi:alpha-D-xyloside xylohydrolase